MAKAVTINEIELEHFDLTIRGTSPLIVHAWSEKARRELFDAQTKNKTGAKHEVKVPTNDFMDSLYWLTEKPRHGADEEEAQEIWEKAVADGAKFGFPVTGIKQAIIRGQKNGGVGAVMTDLRGSMYLSGSTEAANADMAEIVGPTPLIREDMVRVGGMSKGADIRYRAEFVEWEIPMRLTYIKDGLYSLNQILNMIDYGGFCCGIGEWRPQKDGQFGMFELVKQVVS